MERAIERQIPPIGVADFLNLQRKKKDENEKSNKPKPNLFLDAHRTKPGSGGANRFYVLKNPTVSICEDGINYSRSLLARTWHVTTQVFTDFKAYGEAVSLTACCLYGGGGASVSPQIVQLKRGVDIVVRAVGRVK
ncbi:hypothetical protein L6452_04172 [Arctium lappa]|uniref:Uncharacterized protein n=1 Tax=Arctium lappa TaxID=4217 RepID=A0ACB9FQH3_ARCLA|nr:hypothetical protein L6452_04172 [Arctium lappa]